MADFLNPQEADLTKGVFGFDMNKVDQMLSQIKPQSDVDKSIDFASQMMTPDKNIPLMQNIPDTTPNIAKDLAKQEKVFDESAKFLEQALKKSESEYKSALTPEQQKAIAEGRSNKNHAQALDALNKSTSVADIMQYTQIKTGELENRLKNLPQQYKILSRNDVLENMTTGQKIMTSVAAGLGAFGAALTGGPNFAQQNIDAMINGQVQKSKEQYSQALESIKNESALNLTKLDMAVKQFGMKTDLLQKSINGAQAMAQIAAGRSSLTNTKLRASELHSNLALQNAKITYQRESAVYQVKEAGRIANLNAMQDPTYVNFESQGPEGNQAKLVKFQTKEAADQFRLKNQTVIAARQVISDVQNLLQRGENSMAEKVLKAFDAQNNTNLSDQISVPVLTKIIPYSSERVRNKLMAVSVALNDSLDSYAKAFGDSSFPTKVLQPLQENLRGIKPTN